ncbi:MAG TPA: choice-of-anchor Q domain-containing protein, partial [Blastocatellia bacterium]|nr:choice-of-anchor Q domain-containing protein [Blastocatellia bacterium]
GVYNENLTFNGKNVQIQSVGGPLVTTIQAAGGTVVTIGPAGALIGFTVTGGTEAFGAGMMAFGNGSIVRGNIFTGNVEGSGGFGAAIAGAGASPTINGNIFRNNGCDAQFLSGVVSFVNSSSPIVSNNVFENNPCRAIQMTLPVGNSPLVINNTVVGNAVDGIRVDTRIPTSLQVFRNNIVLGSPIGLLTEFGSAANDPTWQNNLVFNNNLNYSGIADQTGVNGNLSAPPLFVDQPNGNYHLQAGSPAIDAGSPVGAPATDFDGNPRGVDTDHDGSPDFDIGAFQFVSAVSPFDVCLQDAGATFQFNSKTGAYQFTRCADGLTLTGTGRIRLINSVLTLTDFRPDRNIRAGSYLGQGGGSALIQTILAAGISQITVIKDGNAGAKTCSCGSAAGHSPGAGNNGGTGSIDARGNTITHNPDGRWVTITDAFNHVALNQSPH